MVIFAYLLKVYFTAEAPKKAAEQWAVPLAEKKAGLREIDDFHLYNGVESVAVIEGKNKSGEKIIVWIPEKKKNVIVLKAKDGLTKQQAIKKVEDSKGPIRIVSVRLGMEKNIPFWEIYYLSDNNLINYYYIHFQTGEWLKKIENL